MARLGRTVPRRGVVGAVVSTPAASATAPLGGLSASAPGQRGTTGTAAAALGAATAAAVGRRGRFGTAAASLTGLTGTAAGGRVALGAATAGLGRVIAAAAGGHLVVGVGTAVLGQLSAVSSGMGTLPPPAAGRTRIYTTIQPWRPLDVDEAELEWLTRWHLLYTPT